MLRQVEIQGHETCYSFSKVHFVYREKKTDAYQETMSEQNNKLPNGSNVNNK